MLVKVYGASVRGLSAIPVTIEVNASRGIKFFLVGLPDNAVKESQLIGFRVERVCGLYGSC